MKPELKSINSPDVDLDKFYPSDRESICIYIDALIGPIGESESETFGFFVCNINWLLQKINSGPIFIRGLIITSSFSPNDIHAIISGICLSIEGNDWSDVATKLSRYGRWEFEDYTPFQENGSEA